MMVRRTVPPPSPTPSQSHEHRTNTVAMPPKDSTTVVGVAPRIRSGVVRPPLPTSSKNNTNGDAMTKTTTHPPNDMRLLLASLDKEALGDEAEATLLEVLERRNVTLATASSSSGNQFHNNHRRGNSTHHQRSASSSRMLNAAGSGITSSTSSSSSRQGLLTRPLSLSSRSISQDVNASKTTTSTSRPRTMTADDANDVDLVQALSDVSDRSSSNHRRIQTTSILPSRGLDRGVSVNTGLNLTTPGERARQVAMLMKSLPTDLNTNNLDGAEPWGGNSFHDLISILEKQRESDNNEIECYLSSSGSQRQRSKTEDGQKSSSGGGEGTTSKNSSSRLLLSVSASNNNNGLSNNNNNGWGGFRPSPPQRPNLITTEALHKPRSNIDHLLDVAQHVAELCKPIPEDEEEEVEEDSRNSTLLAKENANFLSQLASSHPDVPPTPMEEDTGGVMNEETPMLAEQQRKVGQQVVNEVDVVRSKQKGLLFSSCTPQPSPTTNRMRKFLCWWIELRKQMRMLVAAFDGPYVRERLWHFVFENEVPMIIVPALAVSAFFYYKLNNPVLPLLPTNASISWCLLFLLRHYITLQLAYVAQYLIVDVSAVRSLFSVKLVGPLATLYIINARGWPFIITVWGLLGLGLIHHHPDKDEESLFFSHWLYFTDIDMFTVDNPSGSVVESDTYKELLIALIVVGVATSLKRTVLALYLSKRLYNHYKQRLEKVMEMMLLLMEVANLGNAISDHELKKVQSLDSYESTQSELRKSPNANDNKLQDELRSTNMISVFSPTISVFKKGELMSSYSFSDEEGSPLDAPCKNLSEENETMKKSASNEIILDQLSSALTDDDEDDSPIQYTKNGEIILTQPIVDTEPPISSVDDPVSGMLYDASTTARISSLLDGWEEPVNKADKMADPTIHEILQFRKALEFLDDTHPFGSSFGAAFTRESCIQSAKSLYKRMLTLSPGSSSLHFDVIGVLAYNSDGSFDKHKARNLVKLFRPDKFQEVSLLHFVQSCDGVYKRIRYLRASVGNSTLIDNVLENIFNGMFYFALALTIMSLLEINPWTLLVSMSTVLVSFAFALGPSAAKMIEGMIMIAVRRPFDLGDRITIVDNTGSPDNSDDPGYHDTWIVEGCNLFSTTLRLSRTNELSTVNNGAIANTRIVNHGRSLNALVNVNLYIRLDVTNEQVEIVKSTLLQYIRDNPRVWARLINFRIIKVDTANHLIIYSARIEHVKSWQEILPILQAKGDLEYFCIQILLKLDIHYDHYTTTNNVYISPDRGLLGLLNNVSLASIDVDSSDDPHQHRE